MIEDPIDDMRRNVQPRHPLAAVRLRSCKMNGGISAPSAASTWPRRAGLLPLKSADKINAVAGEHVSLADMGQRAARRSLHPTVYDMSRDRFSLCRAARPKLFLEVDFAPFCLTDFVAALRCHSNSLNIGPNGQPI